MEEKVKTWEDKKKTYLLVAFLAMAFGIYQVFAFFGYFKQVNTDALSRLENLVLENDPENINFKSGKYIQLEIKGYEKSFHASDMAYDCMDTKGLMEELAANDTVSIWVKTADLPDLKTDHLVDNNNDFYLLEHNGTTYGDMDCRNQKWHHDHLLGAFIGLLIALLLFLFSRLKKQPHIAGVKIDTEILMVIVLLLMCIFLSI